MTFASPLRRTPGHTLHLAQRGRGRAPCFSCDRDRLVYLEGLAHHAAASGCAVHGYVLMGNHVHLLLTPARADSVVSLLEGLGVHYARHLDVVHGHPDSVWDERPEIRPVFPRRYLLGCMRYIEMNPVRAGLVARPGDYRWSSYGANALGAANPLITPHAFYYALGRSPVERQAAYRALFQISVLRQSCATYELHDSPAVGLPNFETDIEWVHCGVSDERG